MPRAKVSSVELNYEVLGKDGPWVTLLPGGRRSLEEVAGLARLIADAGFRVLLHDRRNTGLSSVSIDGEGSEFEIWAQDLDGLLGHLGIGSVSAIGSSSGCRVSTILTLRRPDLVNALVMMRVTGGAFAVKRLSHRYYTKLIEAAQNGGMAAVCEDADFSVMIKRTPSRRQELLAWDVGRFISVMEKWRANLEADLNSPVLGASVEQLKSIRCPVCIIPGNDKTHSLATGRLVHSIVEQSEIHEPRQDQLDLDLIPMSDWVADGPLATIIIDFLKRSAGRFVSGRP
jgi:pimeloyl-ACP methyl ester carboxylesterase